MTFRPEDETREGKREKDTMDIRSTRAAPSFCQHPPDDSHSRQNLRVMLAGEWISISPSVLPIILMSARVGPIGQRLPRRLVIAIGQHQASLYRADVGGLRLDGGCLPSSTPRKRETERKRDRVWRRRGGESRRAWAAAAVAASSSSSLVSFPAVCSSGKSLIDMTASSSLAAMTAFLCACSHSRWLERELYMRLN